MLILVPTHAQCDAAVAQFTAIGKAAAKYPQRSAMNCGYYSNVKRIESLGFDASGLVCPKCPGKSNCVYHTASREAKKASIVVATHERFHRDGEKLAQGRRYISVHEDLLNILSRSIEVDNFDQIVALAQWGMNAQENYSEAAEQLQAVAEFCRDALLQFNETVELFLPELADPVENVNSHLIHLIGEAVEAARYLPRRGFPDILRQPLNGEAFQLCHLLLNGRVDRLYVRHTCHENGYVEKKLVGIQQAAFPTDSIVILNDGTATPESILPEFSDQIRDITPTGRAEQLQEIVQYPVDVTKSDSSLLRLANSVRTILRLHPDKQQIGLITHQKFIETPDGRCPFPGLLSAEENARIVKTDWFRGTESRGSNSWKEECDLLIVAGTPRVPTSAVQNRLLQLGNPAAAARNGHWATLDYWSGRRLDGKRETVRSRAYRDHDWHEAARQIVHSELVQAIGRARPVCSDGIPLTIVLSTELLGLPLANEKLEIINKRIAHNAVLAIYHLLNYVGALSSENERERVPSGELSCPSSQNCLLDGECEEITDKTAYRVFKQNCPLISSDSVGRVTPTVKTNILALRVLAPRVDASAERQARRIFEELERFGLLTREGVRKGWYLTANNLRLFEQLPPYMFGFDPEVDHVPGQRIAESLAIHKTPRHAAMNALRNHPIRRLVRLGRPMTVADTVASCTEYE